MSLTRDTASEQATQSRIWLDLTGLLEHAGRPIGLQRVAAGLARTLLDAVRPVGFGHYRKHEGFAALEREAVIELLERGVSPPTRTTGSKLRRRIRRRFGAANRSMHAPFAPGDVLLNPGFLTFKSSDRRWLDAHLPGARVRYVGMIYDLIQLQYPEWFDPEQQEMVRDWHRFTGRHAAAILCISQATRRDAERFFARERIDAPPLVVLPLAVEPPRRHGSHAAAPETPFVLSVSTIEVRKNHRLLFQVWRRLLEQNDPAKVPTLVLVGRKGWMVDDFWRELENSRYLDGKIVVRSDVGDEDLERLYETCLFTVFPSICEGFGLPVAESLVRGKYCVASTAPSLAEVGGDLIDYHDPFDVPAAFQLIARAISDAGFRARREAEIRMRYQPRSWRELATDLWQVVDALAVRTGS